VRAGKKEIDWERARKSMTARLSDQQNVLPDGNWRDRDREINTETERASMKVE